MSFSIKTKVPIPPERETRVKILSLAQIAGCYPETRKLYEKYDNYYKNNEFDEKIKFELARNFIKDLSEIDISLILWLVDENGNIHVNNQVVFTVVDEPEELCHG